MKLSPNSEMTTGLQSKIDIIKNHMMNMSNYTFVTRNKKETDYYGINNSGKLTSKMKIGIKREIEDCKEWLRLNDPDSITKITMQHHEDEIRLTLVKNFIYG